MLPYCDSESISSLNPTVSNPCEHIQESQRMLSQEVVGYPCFDTGQSSVLASGSCLEEPSCSIRVDCMTPSVTDSTKPYPQPRSQPAVTDWFEGISSNLDGLATRSSTPTSFASFNGEIFRMQIPYSSGGGVRYDSFWDSGEDLLSEGDVEVDPQMPGAATLQSDLGMGRDNKGSERGLDIVLESSSHASYASEPWTTFEALPKEALVDASHTPVGDWSSSSFNGMLEAQIWEESQFAGWMYELPSACGDGPQKYPKASEINSTECPLVHYLEPQCYKPFQRLYDMRKHEQKHRILGERKFGCEICPQRFKNKKELGRHALTHAASRVGAPQFVCPVLACREKNISFFRKDKFYSHVNSVHNRIGRETNLCNTCGVGFRSPHDLRRHEASKHDVIRKVFRCGFTNCKSKYKVWKRKDNLKEHFRRQHGGEADGLLIER